MPKPFPPVRPAPLGRRTPPPQRRLAVAALLTTGAALVLAFLVAPTDGAQGPVQRLMYLHVPGAWVGFLAFAVVAVSAAAYLRGGRAVWDRRARAAAEIGVGSTTLSLVLGMIWGRQTWGTWWAWDPRLVSTVLLISVYVAHLAVRAGGADRAAAVLGLAGVGIVPVVHFSVVWWRTLHQPPTLLTPAPAPIDGAMVAALLTSLLAFTLLAAWLWTRRLATLAPAPRPLATGVPTPARADTPIRPVLRSAA